MTTQSEALRLADAIDPFVRPSAPDHLTSKRRRQRLRRLVVENKVLHERHHDDNVEYTRVLAQRDLLVRVLKDCEIALRTVAKDDEDFHLARHQVREVRAALKAVEE